MELLSGVHLVGSGRLGFSMSDDHDCNVYLVSSGTDAVLVDAGCGLEAELILSRIERADARSVSRILLTHAHADHAAGARRLASALGADVYASAPVAEILESGDEARAGLTAARRAGTYPGTLELPPTEISRRIGDGTLAVGRLEIEVIETPGHAAGHLSFAVASGGSTALFTGDTLFARGRVAVLATPDTDLAALAASIDRLAAVRPDVLLPGHCEPVLRGATAHIEIARRAMAAGSLPPSLLD